MARSAKPSEGGPEKLSIVVYSGTFEKIHYALAMAAAAVSVDTPATLFFTMKACHALQRASDGANGWRALPSENAGRDGAGRDAEYGARGVGRFEELLEACRALGVRFMICEMGLRAENLSRDDLRDDLDLTPGGIVSFLRDASKNGVLIFI